MNRTLLILLFVSILAATRAEEPARPFPLLGIWRAVSAAAPDGTPAPMNGEAEMEFLADGTMFFTMRDPRNGPDPIRMRWRYRYEPPDVVTYTRDDKTIERQQFSVIGASLYFDHLDYHNTTKLRRIAKTEFTKKPKDIQGLPKLPK